MCLERECRGSVTTHLVQSSLMAKVLFFGQYGVCWESILHVTFNVVTQIITLKIAPLYHSQLLDLKVDLKMVVQYLLQ